MLVDLCRSGGDDAARGRPHRTPARIMATLLRVTPSWFPDRRFVFVGDAGDGTRELARFARRHRPRLVLVSELHPKANLLDPPAPHKGNGRPPIEGAGLPEPGRVVAAAELRDAKVALNGGGMREVGITGGTGHRYKSGRGTVETAWIFARDRTGTHRDEYFLSTDAGMGPAAMGEAYTGRWNIETTSQELRRLGPETMRGWCRRTVLRAAPCPFGLYMVVALLYQALPEPERSGRVGWPGKVGLTFPDALTSARRWLWAEWVLPRAGEGRAVEELPGPLREVLFYALAPAA